MICRINQREQWAARLTHEWKYWNKASFVTLTYSDENLPENCSLRKKDLQNFFHYVRRDERLKDRKIKYFACGEYGDKGGYVMSGKYAGLFIHRPHYHAIIFGLDAFDDDDRKIISENWTLCEPYIFNKKLGIHGEWLDGQAIDYVTPDNINYTCGYVEKKLFGAQKEEFNKKGMETVFSVCSQGLGKQYALDHRKQIEDLTYIQRKGHTLPIPKQYQRWYGYEPYTQNSLAAIMERRQEKDEENHIKKSETKQPFNTEKIIQNALKIVEEKFPDYHKQLTNQRYIKDAEHTYYRIISREIERQADLYFDSMSRRK